MDQLRQHVVRTLRLMRQHRFHVIAGAFLLDDRMQRMQCPEGIPQRKDGMIGKAVGFMNLFIDPAVLAVHILMHIGMNHGVVERRIEHFQTLLRTLRAQFSPAPWPIWLPRISEPFQNPSAAIPFPGFPSHCAWKPAKSKSWPSRPRPAQSGTTRSCWTSQFRNVRDSPDCAADRESCDWSSARKTSGRNRGSGWWPRGNPVIRYPVTV